MRRIVMFNRVSADGGFADADGGLDWVVPEPRIDKGAAKATGGVDTILFGRRTYQMFASFWPRFLDDPTLGDPHAPGRRPPEMVAMARMINDATKIVFSRTLKSVTWKGARLVSKIDPRAIKTLKRGKGKDIMIFGSGSIVTALTALGLIDEYQLVVSPVVLGDGRALFAGLPEPVPVKLLGAKTYPTGTVVLRYAPAR
jgi:dihydrofolate reductase